MRDEGRIKEKIEIVLDSRQVVSIVLGAAVLLGTVFYLGVTVGKDLAVAAAPAGGDPLEKLDQQAIVDVEQKLTFPETLTGEPPPDAPAAVAKPQPAPAEAPKPAEPDKAAEAQKVAEAPKAPEAPKAEAAPAPTRPEPPKAEPKPAPKAEAKSGAFTVQVGALPSRSEADAVVSKLRSKGLSPYVVEADVPGKGTFYRVRLGKFRSREDAKRYLEDLQRETSVSGFVAQVDG